MIERFEAQADPLAAPDLGPGWESTPARYELGSRRVHIMHGQQLSNWPVSECDWAIEHIIPPGGSALETRSRAINIGACLALVEVGVPPGAGQTDARAPMVRSQQRVESERPYECSGQDLSEADITPCFIYCDIQEAGSYPCDVGRPEVIPEDAPDDIPGTELAPSTDAEDLTETPFGPYASVDTGAEADPYVPPVLGSERAYQRSFSAGYKESWYEDPINIDVTRVKNVIGWWHDGRCVRGAPYPDKTYDWYGTSGWALKGNNWNRGGHCSYAWSSSYAKFKNGIFCEVIAPSPLPTGPTYNVYDRNTVRGMASGSVVGIVHARAKGGCNFLLSFNTRTRRTA